MTHGRVSSWEREPSASITSARALLDAVRGRELSRAERVDTAAELAAMLHEAARQSETSEERARREILARLLHDPNGQVFTTCLTDRAHRSDDPSRVVDVARGLLRTLGVPAYLPAFARAELRALLRFGPFVPGLAARGVLARLRRESAHVVLSAGEPALSTVLARFASTGVRVNLNDLGEAVLGEREAGRRVDRYVTLLSRTDVEHVSIKLTSIASRIDLAAFDDTLARVRERLTVIYRAALAQPRADGRSKLVTLDMESHRDLELAIAAFRGALAAPELLGLGAGLALQAYVPESVTHQQELIAWARARTGRGGAPIHLRLVKGANLLAERAEASLRVWPLPIHPDKASVDAAFKHMLDYACRPEHVEAARLGVASHNVFDLAYALVLRAERSLEEGVGLELLAGMADPLGRVLRALAGDVLVYAPVVDDSTMHTAIAYLVRRLDEGTAPENFLRREPSLRAGNSAWQEERTRFETACRESLRVDAVPRKAQDRGAPPPRSGEGFANEADTDFSLARNRTWIREALARAAAIEGFVFGSRVAGETIVRTPLADGFDPSRPGVVPYRVALASEDDVERALATAAGAAPVWARTAVQERVAILRRAADELAAARGELVATMVLDAGKRVEEGDVEVSEAIDFARYYAERALEAYAMPYVELCPRGVALVTPPWNFPLAIPAGGTFAALAAGHAVILKPAGETPLVALRLAELCWKAGVPERALQLVLCEDTLGSRLVADPRVGCVVLTGGTATARHFLSLRPDLALFAETGGKNAIIASATCDRDLAISDVVRSAFGHAGQKCSAASLFVLEQELYTDPRFLEALRDASESLPVGSAWDPASVVTPLIRPPVDPLRRGLTALESGERWLLAPRASPENPRLWTPGIKLDVPEGGFTHQTELFGPVLALMRANDLDHAIDIANATPYGLTAGLHSLDEREQARWTARIDAGNLYVNRAITGAIVERQPFGGVKASSFGPGAKAGGPNYVLQLCRVSERARPDVACAPEPEAVALVTRARGHLKERQRERLSAGACDYARAWHAHFRVDLAPSVVLGERNLLRYLPCDPLLVRASTDADPVDVLLACAAALTAVIPFVLSLSEQLAEAAPFLARLGLDARVEDAERCAARVAGSARVRVVGTPEAAICESGRAAGVHVAADPVVTSGRVELLRIHREQALSLRWHRYGSLAGEALLPPLRGGSDAGPAPSRGLSQPRGARLRPS